MKKILFLMDSLQSGGAERQSVGLATMLNKRNYKVVFISWNDNEKDYYLDLLLSSGVNYINHPELLNKKKRIFNLFKIIRKYAPDIIISFSPSAILPLCILSAFVCFPKLIVSERTLTHTFTNKDTIKALLYKFADFVVCNSISQSLVLSHKFPFLEKKIHTITNYVDLNMFYSPIRTIQDFNSLNCVVVGRVSPAKNYINFIKAVRILKDNGLDIKVDCYGHFNEEKYSDRCKNLIKDYDLESMIILHGETSNIAEKYRQANLLCLPSLREGYPNAVCEGMACGLPVLASAISDIPTIIEDGINGILFNPLDPEDIASSFYKYNELSLHERLNMSINNIEKSQRIFGMKQFEYNFLKLIKSKK